jgi:hypothetical protein
MVILRERVYGSTAKSQHMVPLLRVSGSVYFLLSIGKVIASMKIP